MSTDSSTSEQKSGQTPSPSRSPGAWTSLHLWHIQPIRDVLLLAAIFAVIYLGYRLSMVTVPMLLALALAYLFEPLVVVLTRKKLLTRAGVAIGLIFGAALLIVVPATVGLSFGLVQGTQYARTFANKVQVVVDAVEKPDDPIAKVRLSRQGPAWQQIAETYRSLKAEHQRAISMDIPPPTDAPSPQGSGMGLGVGSGAGSGVDARPSQPPKQAVTHTTTDPTADPNADPMADAATEQPMGDPLAAWAYSVGARAVAWIQDHTRELAQGAFTTGAGVIGIASSFAGSLGSLAFGAFLTAFFFFFFCTGFGDIKIFLASFVPDTNRATIFSLLRKMDRVIAAFIRGRLTICAILAVYYSLAYWIIGVPAPLILGPIVGILCLLPYCGGIGIPISVVLLMLSAKGDGITGTWYFAVIAPLAVHGIAQIIDDYILTPRIQGEGTDMDTPSILFASLAGGILGGFYGLLLAIPVAACAKIVIKEVIAPRIRDWAAGKAKDPLPVGPRET